MLLRVKCFSFLFRLRRLVWKRSTHGWSLDDRKNSFLWQRSDIEPWFRNRRGPCSISLVYIVARVPSKQCVSENIFATGPKNVSFIRGRASRIDRWKKIDYDALSLSLSLFPSWTTISFKLDEYWQPGREHRLIIFMRGLFCKTACF